MKLLQPVKRNHSVRFTSSDEMPKYKSLDESPESLPHFSPQYQNQDSGAPSPDCSYVPAAQRYRLNEQRIKLLTSINQIVQQRAELESSRATLASMLDELRRKLKRRIEECQCEKKDRMKIVQQRAELESSRATLASMLDELRRKLKRRIEECQCEMRDRMKIVQQRAELESSRATLASMLDELRRKLKRRIEECQCEKRDRMKALKQSNLRLEKEKYTLIADIEHLKRHLDREEAHHLKHARSVVAQTIQGIVKNAPVDPLFSPCSVSELPNLVCRNVARNAPSRVADNKLAAARLMRDIAELRSRVAHVEARLASELKRKRQAELDIIRLRKELSTTKSCVASLRLPGRPLGKHCAKFA